MPQRSSSLRFFLLILLAVITPTILAAPLQSPWDLAPVTPTDAPYACPALAHLAADLTTDGFYRLDDPTHSIVDPVRMAAYQKSSNGVKHIGAIVIAAADAWRTTGSRAAAKCATSQFISLSQQNSLNGKMSSQQAYYVQGWVAGEFAISYLKVRGANLATPEQAAQIARWLQSVGAQDIAYYDAHAAKAHDGNQNNHLYWAGVEIAAIGVVANNKKDVGWAFAAYDNGVNQIQPDGSLPLEMQRGSKALHYHLYALAPLVLLAEFGAANHIDLYADNHGAIHRLVAFCINGVVDPAPFVKATRIAQENPADGKYKTLTGDQIGWAPPYVARFPNQPASALLEKYIRAAPSLSVPYLGGLPPPQ